MLIYCVSADGKESVTIGTLLWLPMGKCLSDYNEDEAALLAICRPHDELKKARFNGYIDVLKQRGPVTYCLERDLPPRCKRRMGFWENNGVG